MTHPKALLALQAGSTGAAQLQIFEGAVQNPLDTV